MTKHPHKRSTRATRATYRAQRQPFQRLVRALRARDPDIIEIVQFGSSVYAPRHARDVDVFVLTRAKKEYAVYLDATTGYRRNIDIVVAEPGERIGADIALALVTFSKTLYGNGKTRKEAMNSMAVPTFERARKYVLMADEQISKALEESTRDFRDARYRLAFDLLFDAARYAAMTFLALDEQTRWSELPRQLPTPFNKQFRELISFLHVQFNYQGTYPRDRADETFQEWRAKVSAFIDALEHATVKG
jgi:hypothetical protein